MMLAAAASGAGSNANGGQLVLGWSGVSGRGKFFVVKPKALPPRRLLWLASLKTRQKEVGFQVLVGAAQKLHPSLDAGAVGAILAFASTAPTACYEIYTAWKEGDTELARLKQQRIAEGRAAE